MENKQFVYFQVTTPLPYKSRRSGAREILVDLRTAGRLGTRGVSVSDTVLSGLFGLLVQI